MSAVSAVLGGVLPAEVMWSGCLGGSAVVSISVDCVLNHEVRVKGCRNYLEYLKKLLSGGSLEGVLIPLQKLFCFHLSSLSVLFKERTE